MRNERRDRNKFWLFVIVMHNAKSENYNVNVNDNTSITFSSLFVLDSFKCKKMFHKLNGRILLLIRAMCVLPNNNPTNLFRTENEILSLKSADVTSETNSSTV